MKLKKLVSLAVAGTVILTSARVELYAGAEPVSALEADADGAQKYDGAAVEADPQTAAQLTEPISGIWGENLTWTLDEDGKLTISGTGEMKSETYNEPLPWKEYAGKIKTVVITEGVTSIGDSAFWHCSSLASISIPEGVTSIGWRAFSGCSSLTSVSIPRSVTSIGVRALEGCSSLTSISIPESVKGIGPGAFSGCSSVTSITVDEKNPNYDSRDNCNAIIETETNTLLYGCSNTIIPGGVTSIGYGAFSGCSSLTSISIPGSVTSIGDDAFYGCSSLTGVTIPEGVISIGNSAFSDCSSLASITIPENVTSIGEWAFKDCSSLTSISIPESVTSIGDYAFSGCSSLASVSIPASVTSIGWCAFSGCSSLASVSIPASVTSIGDFAFSGCSSLTSISIPESVTSIGSSAFSGCSSVTSITVDEKNPNYDSRENCNAIIETETNTLIAGCSNTTIPGSVTSIGGDAFSGCSSLTSISIPESVTSIGDYAFSGCSSLTSISIPKSVTSIGDSVFFGCSSLASVSIPASVTSIERGAFSGCSSLASVSIPASVTSIGDYAFSGCSSLTSISIPESVTSIERGAFSGCSSLASVTVDEKNPNFDSRNDCNAIIKTETSTLISGCRNTVIPEGVTSIGDYAFDGCSSLTSITIPEGVTSIGDYAFRGCSSVKSITVDEKNLNYDSRNNCNAIIETATNTLLFGCSSTTIPESVTGIGESAFSGCSGLTGISIPEGVTSIGNYAFKGCSSLASISIPESVTSIGIQAFSSCSGLTNITVDEKNAKYDSRNHCNAIIETETNTLIVGCSNTTIPESVTSIGDVAFYGCSSLTSISIPESVTSIGDSAFRGCSSLTSISIPGSVTNIGEGAFEGCSSLKSVSIPASVTSIGDSTFMDCSSELTLLVEKGSYAETYAKEHVYNYRAVYILDASEKPVLSKDDMAVLIEKNAENDVVITTDTGVTFTFAKGTMKAVDTAESYNFNTVISFDFTEASLPDSVKKEDFVAKVSYQYSGELPAEAEIKLPVGKKYAGRSVLYSEVKADGTLGEGQRAVVDAGGFLTVKQSHCSDYVVTLIKDGAYMPGDVDHDGNITTDDALWILMKLAGKDTNGKYHEDTADCDGKKDGITTDDALWILMKLAGKL